MQLNGYAYSRLQEECENTEEEAKLRALAFFGLLAFLVNMDNWSDLEGLKGLKGSTSKEYLSIFQRTSAAQLVVHTQKLIRLCFQTG